MTEQAHKIERWTFGGNRVGTDGKRVHAWIDPDERELYFKTSGSPAIGSIYQIKVIRDGKKVSILGKPEYTGDRSDDQELVDSLWAQHKAAELTLSVKARERADKRNDPVEEAIERLVRLAATIPPSQRAAFAGYVTHRLSKAYISK